MLGPLFLNESETSENATAECSGGKETQPVQKTMGRLIVFKIQETSPIAPSFPTGSK